MNARARQRYELLRRVYAFGDAHAEQFPTGTIGRNLFASVGKCVEDVTKQAAARMSRHGEVVAATGSRSRARRRLFGLLVAIRRTARAIAVERAGFDKGFELPRGNGDRTLLTASRVFARIAREQAPEFMVHGLPSSFLDDLSAGIDALEEAIRARAASRVGRMSSRRSIKTALDHGFLTLRKLDAVVPNLLGDESSAIAAWRRVRRRMAKKP